MSLFQRKKAILRDRSPTLTLGIAASMAFIALMAGYYDFTLDDAFITFRYSKHLAEGHGIVWNVGEDPVEGYSSFLWMVLNALAMLLGLDPVSFSKTILALSALAILWLLAFSCRNVHWGPAFVLMSAIALNPPFAFLTMQAMETALTALLVLIAAIYSLAITSCPSNKSICWLYATLFLGALSRPDTIPFAVGFVTGLFVLCLARRDFDAAKKLCYFASGFLLLGGVYMVWRISYFGYLFPNTYYIKIDNPKGFFKAAGIDYLESFVVQVLWPYLIFSGILLVRRFAKSRFVATVPILMGCALHAFYILTIMPYQGFFWRYIFPIYPALLLVMAHWLGDRRPTDRSMGKNLLYAAIVLLSVAWNLRFLPETYYQKRYRTQHDRVVMGHRLSGLDGVMLTTASGAIPFYSEWKAVDMMGLNSEEIAHRGLTAKLLEDLRPDLIILHSLMFQEKNRGRLTAVNYMLENGFVAVAFVYRSPEFYMCYFARRESRLFVEIQRRLVNVEELRYGNLRELMLEDGIATLEGTP